MKIYKIRLMKNFSAITLAPIGIFVAPSSIDDPVTLNHERIHWEQQKKLGLFKFYTKYLYEAATKGYRNISFEIEAYANENNFEYHP